MLPEALLLYLNDQIPRRQLQIQQLASLLNPNFPSPATLVLYGLEATGKSLTVKAVLQGLELPHAIIRSQECITTRHLLERTVAACKDALREEDTIVNRNLDARCESLNALVVQLQSLLQGDKKFVLVLDGIDGQREAPPTLLPAIARLGETIPQLVVVLVVTAPRPRFLRLAGVPHVHFHPYDRSDSIAIVSRAPLSIFASTTTSEDLTNHLASESNEDDVWLWSRFCGAVWDSLSKGAGRNVVDFRRTCEKLWSSFVKPIRDGTFGTRDFSKLMVRNRALFQAEVALIEGIIPVPFTEDKKNTIGYSHELPYYTKYLLLAAYLASFNPSRQDQVFFMKSSDKKRRKKGGGTAGGRPAKHRKIQRKLLGPQPFVLERMLAIFHAIIPHNMPSGIADIMTQIATLASLRLLLKTPSTADVLDAGTKWRVNASYEYIKRLAKEVRFDVESYLAE
ncbi:MAG: hypothetical protein Q9187_003441 [Circinaria calcarea]